MMIVFFVLVWDDLVEVMKKIVEFKYGEEVLVDLVFDWLDQFFEWWLGVFKFQDLCCFLFIDFECLNMKGLYRIVELIVQVLEELYRGMMEKFEEGQKNVDFYL